MTKSETANPLTEGTVGAALAWARERLARASVESPQLTAELLLRHQLGWDRARILTHPEARVPEGDLERMSEHVYRRCQGEPLQYLLGEQEFFGLPFRVTRAVLIPRPETELLVETALELARRGKVRALRIADVGTGSGCIAVTVAHHLPEARVWAIDISPEALAVARGNADRHNVLPRMEFVCGDLLQTFPPRPQFDFILSNPPYVPGAEIPELDAVVRDHEPRQALHGGATGLELPARLINEAAERLIPGAWLLMEIGAGQAGGASWLVQRSGLRLHTIVEDLRSIPRCVVAQKPMENADG